MKGGLFAKLRVRLHTMRAMLSGNVRANLWRLQGASIGTGTLIPRLAITWPHQVQIGNNCQLEPDIFFKFDGTWCQGPSIIIGDDVFIGRGCEFNIKKKITIGQGCAIASGCKFIDHDHGILRNFPVRIQPGIEKPIEIGFDCWIGVNAVILKGITIGNGAIIGAGGVLTKSVPPYEVWGGVPAKRIGIRK